MTTQPTPGQHVLVDGGRYLIEAVAEEVGGSFVLRPVSSDPNRAYRGLADPDRCRWRPMPDETATAPPMLAEGMTVRVAGDERLWTIDEADLTPHACLWLTELTDIPGSAAVAAEFAALGDLVEQVVISDEHVEARMAELAEPLAAGVPVGCLAELADGLDGKAWYWGGPESRYGRTLVHYSRRIRELIAGDHESCDSHDDVDPRPSAMLRRVDFATDDDSLEAGILVRDLEGEPGPGAYLIGDEPNTVHAVRLAGDRAEHRWFIEATVPAKVGGWSFRRWEEILELHADKPMRRLLPRSEPTAVVAANLGAASSKLGDHAPGPLTLDPDCVDRWPGCWRFPDPCRCRPDGRVVPAVELPEATQADVDRALHLASVAAASRDRVMAELATHRTAQVKLMQHLGMDGAPGEVADEAIRVIEDAKRERDLAIAHDRQPYPTADAYESTCRALEKHRARADQAETERDEARRERDEAQRLRDSPFQALATLRRLLRDAEQVYTRMPLREKLAINVAAETQEPAQTPADDRDPACVEAWPECFSGGYDPHCCRFPKSCSCVIVDEPAQTPGGDA